MHDARDAEDTRLLEAGEIGLLLEGYLGVILDRCRANVRNPDDALDVAQNVYERLLRELKRGRRYRVPFRVVVHQVTGWKIREHFQAKRYEEDIDETLYRLSTESDEPIDVDAGFDAMLEGLTELEAEVMRLHYGEADLDFQEIARRLGKEPNAVHQIHFRALVKLRKDAA
jgi:RNA polymerase sigma factor (sigma-70 family)